MIDMDSILKAITIILENAEAENTTLSSLQAAAVTAVSTLCGALVMGPVGIVAGASLGSIGMYFTKKDSFKPLHRVISEDLTASERESLANHVQNVISKFEITDAIMLMAMANSNAMFRGTVTKSVASYLGSKLPREH